MSFACERCGQNFKSKSGRTNHMNKKVPCIAPPEEIGGGGGAVIVPDTKAKKTTPIAKKESIPIAKKVTPKKQITPKSVNNYQYLRLPINETIIEIDGANNALKRKYKKEILEKIDRAHNILYNEENIEGSEALSDIMNFLFIKLIQPILSSTEEPNKIDLLNKEYYRGKIDDTIIVDTKNNFTALDRTLKCITDLDFLLLQGAENIRNSEEYDIIRQMGEILTTHIVTRNIFSEINFIKANNSTTIIRLLKEIFITLNVEQFELHEDAIGEIYEHIINKYVKKGSKLGQYFTPRKVMHLICNYKRPTMDRIINEIEENIKFYDSCMGTAGWLITGFNMLKEQYGERMLLSGGDVKPSTFQYGLMNLILTLKKFPHNVQCNSSLTHVDNEKYHFILTNPPFQTEKKFDQVAENFKADMFTTRDNGISLNDIYFLKSNTPPIQFLELNLYKLEENGMCIIILPYGEMFFGSTQSKMRLYFMNTANVTDIILFESGTFTHTGIKTCALIIEKGTITQEINFLSANKACDKLTKITTVTIGDIKKEVNNSWYAQDYLQDGYIEELSTVMTNFEWVEFGSIFDLEKGTLQSGKAVEDENGEGVFITKDNKNRYKKINKDLCTNSGENIFISNMIATCVSSFIRIKYHNGYSSHSDLIFKLTIKSDFLDKINVKFIYYFLKTIEKYIENTYFRGALQESLDQKNFNRMKIPIPSLADQEKIINNIIELEEGKKDIIKGLESNYRMRMQYMEVMIKNASNKRINRRVKLGEIIEFLPSGKRKSSEGDEVGKYPLYYCSINNILYMDEFDFEGDAITMNITNGSGKCNLFHARGRYSVAESTLHFKSKDETVITTNILYNYLKLIKSSISKVYRGTQQMSINKEDFSNKIDVLIPPIEYQMQMEEMLTNADALDDGLNTILTNFNEGIKTAFMNSMDDYGNPNGFNLDKILDDA